jgi:hypothetical protein
LVAKATRLEKTCHHKEQVGGAKLKKKAISESTRPATAPIRASHISARVELTPLTSDGDEVNENVTQTNVVDIHRYLRWAAKAIEKRARKQARKDAPPKAA